MNKRLLFLLIFLVLSFFYVFSCTTVAVSKGFSKTGDVLLGKNRDLSPDSAQILIFKPEKKYKKGENVKLQFIEIPQVSLTYSFYGFKSLDDEHKNREEWRWGNGMGVNEFGVAVADNDAASWWKYEGDESKKLHDNDVVRLILERCKTAYEGVLLIDKLLKDYFIEIPEMYTIADKNEVWIVETCYKFWVAIRVKTFEVRANRFEIKYPDLPDNSGRFNLKLEKLIKFLKEKKRYVEEGGKFSFRKSMCDYFSKENIHYNDIRYNFALSTLKKVKKISVKDIKKVLRSHFENYVYTLPDGKKILPFNPLSPPHCQIPGAVIKENPTRTICYSKTVGSMIVEINGSDVEKSVMWCLFSKPCLNFYFPIFPISSNVELPELLKIADSKFSSGSFWWICERFVRLLDNNYKKNLLLRSKFIRGRNKIEKIFEKRVSNALKSRNFRRRASETFLRCFKDVINFVKRFTSKIKGDKRDISPVCTKKSFETCDR